MGGWQAKRLIQEEARLLGVCERTFRHYVDRYVEEGFQGLIDKQLSQVSHRREAPPFPRLNITAPLGRGFPLRWNTRASTIPESAPLPIPRTDGTSTSQALVVPSRG